MHTPATEALTRIPTLAATALLALMTTLALAPALAAAPAAAATSSASESAPGIPTDLTVVTAWIRWLPAGLPAGGYVTLANRSDQPLVLTGASSADFGQIAFHRNVPENGLSKMVPVTSITVPPHSTLDFATSGYHLMLMQPTRAISPGAHVVITLQFAGGQAQSVNFEVRPPNGSSPHKNMPGMSGMGDMPGMAGMPH